MKFICLYKRCLIGHFVTLIKIDMHDTHDWSVVESNLGPVPQLSGLLGGIINSGAA